MGSKHLRQLLDEDQEPFVLQNYIDERRLQLIRKPKSISQHIKKRKPISENSSFPISLCKNACFSPLHASPEITKSPLFYFSTSSQPQSPFRPSTNTNSDTLFIHVPSRTAALLLEAALRIQRQSGSQKPKSHKGRLGFGLFGSILSKFSHSKRTRKREIMEDRGVRVSVKDILRWDSNDTDVIREPTTERTTTMGSEEDKRVVVDLGLSCSCKIEERFADFETSTSRRAGDCEETETEFAFEDLEKEGSCSSSPFRFSLMNNSSEIGRLPELGSPATSPSCRKKQVVKNEEVQQDVLAKGYDEEEKEHSSPVSVLDPQFKENDDDEDGEVHEDENEDNDGLELECSFAIVQRTKQKLLWKLRRFERLAELDPIELEKRILEEEDEEEYNDVDDSLCSSEEDNSTVLAREVLSCSSPCDCQRVSKKLILDLAKEEERALGFEDKELLTKKLCRRLGSWKETKMKTIDMMVEFDLKREGQGWEKNHEEEVQDMGALIELGIFKSLVEELVHDSSTCM